MTDWAEVEKLVGALKAQNEPIAVHIVLETDGGTGAVDGVYLDEAMAIKRCEELNFRQGDSNFACVVSKYVSTPTGYLTKGALR